jgi:hypothetical protein
VPKAKLSEQDVSSQVIEKMPLVRPKKQNFDQGLFMLPDEIAREDEDVTYLEDVLRAAEVALETDAVAVVDVIARASNGMPREASDFDRGLAGGVALARYLALQARAKVK